MRTNPFLKALFILLGVIFLAVGVIYWFGLPAQVFEFSTTYSINIKPAPAENPATTIELPGVIHSFDITRDGSRIAIATSKNVILYDLKTLKELYNFPVSEKIVQVRFSPDGNKLAVSGIILKYFESGRLHVTVWDANSRESVYEYKSETDVYNPAGAIAWSPDGERLAFSVPDRGLSVIDVNTGKTAAALDDFIVSPFDISWSPNGSRLISTGDLGYGLRRWRLDNNKWVRLWDARLQPASQVKWSPDGKQIASGHFGGNVCIWDTWNNQCEGRIRAHFNSVDALDWSPDGGQIATASGAIRIWDTHTGKMLSAFGFYDGIIYRELHWFNLQTIAALETSYTKNIPATIRFWDVATGDVKLAFRGWDDSQSGNNGGLTLLLDDVKISSDHTIVQVSLLFDNPDISLAGDWNIFMTDSRGKIYPLTNITPQTMDYGKTHVYQTVPLAEDERITLELKSFPPNQGLSFMQDFSMAPGVFTFDPGSLQVGESLPLNEIVDIGFPLRLTRAKRTSVNELLFEFDSEQYYTGAMLSSPKASGSSSGNMSGNKFTSAISFAEMPKEPIQIQVARIYYNAHSAWFLDFHIAKSMFTDLPPAAPISISQPETAFTSQDPLFLEAQSLVEKFNTSLPKEAGWAHVIKETVTEHIQPGQTYPPPYYKEDQWFEVDANGQVARSLTTDLDKDQNILQQSVSVGPHNMNLTTGEAMEFPTYRLSLDWILRDLNEALNRGEAVSRKEIVCEDGSPCLLIAISNGSFSRRVWINTTTGQQVKLQTIQQMPDGTESVQFTQKLLSVEWAENPPQEVLAIFSKVMFPVP